MKFPRATLQDQKDGWTIDVSLLYKIASLTERELDGEYHYCCMEQVESVLLALEAIQEDREKKIIAEVIAEADKLGW